MGEPSLNHVDLDQWLELQPQDVRVEIGDLTGVEAAQAIYDQGGGQLRRLVANAWSICERPHDYVSLEVSQGGVPYQEGNERVGTVRVVGTSLRGPDGNQAAQRAWQFAAVLKGVLGDTDIFLTAAKGDHYLLARSAGRAGAVRSTLMTRYTGRLVAAIVLPRVYSQMGIQSLVQAAGLYPLNSAIRNEADFLAYFEESGA